MDGGRFICQLTAKPDALIWMVNFQGEDRVYRALTEGLFSLLTTFVGTWIIDLYSGRNLSIN